MDPQQKLFSSLLVALRAKSYEVYDGALPPEGTPYPFIYLGDNQTIDAARKGAWQGIVYQTIHIWSDDVKRRGDLSAMILAVKETCREIENSTGWMMSECSTQILPDNTTKTPLLHAVIETGFRF